ncbi:HNH endonuclease signature motif containing protein [Rhizobium sp. LC145]|uniref:HNH endonuclease n=1 Tax=Rhizobium sp. LC145 TaxID=1120688 RepID=UPI000629EAB0|nr:HNH endonuclease signature motif containing protein [Rhizobium sp. LC145]KKX33997.1 HNH endonuclease [Rhizobium sp. LC145]TKT67036.1 HNH endonuclease [Rhizobiaceae bacterium LC148]
MSKIRRSVLLKLFDRQDGRCCYCGALVIISADREMQRRPDAATIEHIRRRADGGTNHMANLACACLRCNRERGDLDWLTYATFRRGEFLEFMAAIRRP